MPTRTGVERTITILGIDEADSACGPSELDFSQLRVRCSRRVKAMW